MILATFVAAACASAAPSWTFTPPSPSPSTAPSAAASAGASGGGSGSTIQLTAQGIAFDKSSLSAKANSAFEIQFQNNDGSIQHDVAITDSSGQRVFSGDAVTGVGSITYNVPALPAGTYTFVCTFHPNMTGTLTVQ